MTDCVSTTQLLTVKSEGIKNNCGQMKKSKPRIKLPRESLQAIKTQLNIKMKGGEILKYDSVDEYMEAKTSQRVIEFQKMRKKFYLQQFGKHLSDEGEEISDLGTYRRQKLLEKLQLVPYPHNGLLPSIKQLIDHEYEELERQ